MLRYSRTVPSDVGDVDFIEAHQQVRAHLSAVTHSDDDRLAYAEQVQIWTEPDDDGGTKVLGELDAEPDAPYLRDDFDPEADTEFTFARYSEEGRQ